MSRELGATRFCSGVQSIAARAIGIFERCVLRKKKRGNAAQAAFPLLFVKAAPANAGAAYGQYPSITGVLHRIDERALLGDWRNSRPFPW